MARVDESPASVAVRLLFVFGIVVALAIVAWRTIIFLRYDAYAYDTDSIMSRFVTNEAANRVERLRFLERSDTQKFPEFWNVMAPSRAVMARSTDLQDLGSLAMSLHESTSGYDSIQANRERIGKLCAIGRSIDPKNGFYDATEACAIAVGSYIHSNDLHLQRNTQLICSMMRERFAGRSVTPQQAVRSAVLLSRAVKSDDYIDHMDRWMNRAVKAFDTGWDPQNQRLISRFLRFDGSSSSTIRMTQGILLAWAVTYHEHPHAPDVLHTLLLWLHRRSLAVYDLEQLRGVYADAADLERAVRSVLKNADTGSVRGQLAALQTALGSVGAMASQVSPAWPERTLDWLEFYQYIWLPTPPYASMELNISAPQYSRMAALIESERYLLTVMIIVCLLVLGWQFRYRSAYGYRGFRGLLVSRRIWADLVLVWGGYWAFTRWYYTLQAERAALFWPVIHKTMPLLLLLGFVLVVLVLWQRDTECVRAVADEPDALRNVNSVDSSDKRDADTAMSDAERILMNGDNTPKSPQVQAPYWLPRAVFTSIVFAVVVQWVLGWAGTHRFSLGGLGVVSSVWAFWSPKLQSRLPTCSLGNWCVCLVVLCALWGVTTLEQLQTIKRDVGLYAAPQGLTVTMERRRMDACRRMAEPIFRQAHQQMKRQSEGARYADTLER